MPLMPEVKKPIDFGKEIRDLNEKGADAYLQKLGPSQSQKQSKKVEA